MQLSGLCGLQALAVVQAFRSEWPVLIVAPVSLKDNWADEAHRWLGVLEKDAMIVSNPSDLERARLDNIPMVIANYELLSKSEYAPGKLGGGQQLNFKVIVCDESHRIKNHKVCNTHPSSYRLPSCCIPPFSPTYMCSNFLQ